MDEATRWAFSDLPQHVLDQAEQEENAEQLSPLSEYRKQHFYRARLLLGMNYPEYDATPEDITDFLLSKVEESLAELNKGNENSDPNKKGFTPISHFHLCLSLALSQLFSSSDK